MTNFSEDELPDVIARHTKLSYFVGLDLGQTNDPTALSVLERRTAPVLHAGYRFSNKLEFSTSYQIRHLERLPLGLSYPTIVHKVSETMNTAPVFKNARLIIDQTGVGRPVFDLFKDAGMEPLGVTITAGLDWSRETYDNFRVPKGLLVSRLQAAIHTGMVKAHPSLKEAHVLRGELADFRGNRTETGYQQFGARSGKHDDLVLSVAIALWYALTIGNDRMQAGKARV